MASLEEIEAQRVAKAVNKSVSKQNSGAGVSVPSSANPASPRAKEVTTGSVATSRGAVKMQNVIANRPDETYAPADAQLILHFKANPPRAKLNTEAQVFFTVAYKNIVNPNSTSIRPAKVHGNDFSAKVIDPSGQRLEEVDLCQVKNGTDSDFAIVFPANKSGKFELSVGVRNVFEFVGQCLVGGPVSTKSFIEGERLVPVGEYNFRVQAVDTEGNKCTSGGDKFEYALAGGNGGFKNFRSSDNGDGTYKLSIQLLVPSAVFELSVTLNGDHISNSPFMFETLS